MLKRLQIKNLAIIENVDVTFREGFTVLTGESGAGKSLIIDSLSLLLGERASSELIRQGEEKATITGTFTPTSKRLIAYLATLEIPFLGELTIERVMAKSKSTIKANGLSISLGQLARIASLLADIHSQFDVTKILNPDNYLSIIDGYAYDAISQMKDGYLIARNDFLRAKADYEDLLKTKQKLDENRDFLEYQYKELKEANLEEGEEEAILSEIEMLRNYDKVYSLAMDARSLIDDGFLDKLYELNKTLAKLSPYLPPIKENAETLDERYYEIEGILSSLKKSFSHIDYDPARLNELEQRAFDLKALKRKYKKDISSLIAYFNELESMLGKNSNIEDQIKAKKKEMDSLLLLALQKGNDLSKVRKDIAKSIEKEIKGNLKDLLLESNFEIVFTPSKNNESDLKESGIDEIDFLIETNIGEGMKSLSKTISGGEASRIMLAFKAIFIKANRIETVIFDEIDTGISGVAAMAVAKKIHEISYGTQVISITHLPQVASFSDQSVLIAKKVFHGRTYVEIKELSLEEKVEEVAHLISGGTISPSQREYAKEMVFSAKTK